MAKWSDLNKKQKKVFGSKLEYQQAKQRGGYTPKDVIPRERGSFDAPNKNKKFGHMSKHLDKKYKDLTPRQKEKLQTESGVVPYNRSFTGVQKEHWENERVRQGFKNEPLIKGTRDKNLDKKWNALSSKQKRNIKDAGGSKQSFNEARKKKMAQDNLVDFMEKKRVNELAPNVDRLRDYDTTAGGGGSDRGVDRLSRADLKHLNKMGFDKERIIKYSEKKVAQGSKQGEAAQRLLERYKSKVSNKTDASNEKPATNPEPEVVDTPTTSTEPTTPTTTIESTTTVETSGNNNKIPEGMSMTKAEKEGYLEVDDSPEAQQARFDMFSNNMRKNTYGAQSFLGSALASLGLGKASGLIMSDDDYGAKMQGYRKIADVNRSRANLKRAALFGDMARKPVPNWNDPEPPEEIKMPDFDDYL